MKFLILLLFPLFARAESLEVISVEYKPAPQAVSCGLLHQRALEREKAIRELVYLDRQNAHGNGIAMLQANNLLTNKLFLPKEVWRDLSAEVIVTAKIPDGLMAQLERGDDIPFIGVKGPGFLWASYSNQLPDEMSIEFDKPYRLIQIRYSIYLNELCGNPRALPKVEWRPSDSPDENETVPAKPQIERPAETPAVS